MWNRIKRIFRSLFGWLIRGAEDPELILEQLRDDLRQKIPKMNRQAAEVIKHKERLEMELDRHTDEVARLKPQVETAVRAGPERKEAAKALIMELRHAEQRVEETQKDLEQARERAQKILEMRDAYQQRVRQQVREIQHQLSRADQADVEEEMASIMGEFETGDETETLQSMTENIDEKLAQARARMEVAETDVDFQIAQLQQQADMDEAEQTYEEYRRQLGLEPETESAEAEKTMDQIPIEDDEKQEATEDKTREMLEQEETNDSKWGRPESETRQE